MQIATRIPTDRTTVFPCRELSFRATGLREADGVIAALRAAEDRRHHSEARERRADVELARHVEALERSNQESVAYIVSQDLKEPLRGLFNNARFLREDSGDKLDPAGVGRLRRLGYLSQHMSSLSATCSISRALAARTSRFRRPTSPRSSAISK
jgi:light-regulated signal transduction histidine kinase (bacteriophytochrome)